MPISYIYSRISARNYKKKYKYKSKKSKVVAVGALTVGGSGKTIVTQSICEILASERKKAAVLSRGYGRSSNEVLLVNNLIHSYKDVGDEPLLLSRHASIFVGKDRSESAKLAEHSGFNFLVLDDGIMQKYLKPDLKLIVIDSEQGVGNDEMFPLGPKRLDFNIIKSDIDAVIILGYETDCNFFAHKIPNSMEVIYGQLHMDFSRIKNKKIIAFCGIGYPDKFFNSLKDFELIKVLGFPDHYPFSEKDLLQLISEAKNHRAQLVTTEKDLVRIPRQYRSRIIAIPIKIIWKEEEKLRELLSS